MATAEIYRASGSLRNNSSSIWRNSGAEVFSRSSRDEDDEEALKWAALEKLPTYNRLRKGLLMGSHGVSSEIDIQNLGFQEKKNLMERLVKTAEEDNEKFLLKLKNRIDRFDILILPCSFRFLHFLDYQTVASFNFLVMGLLVYFIFRVGIDLPEIEVRFEHLTIDAEAYVGSRALPSLVNFAFNGIEVT